MCFENGKVLQFWNRQPYFSIFYGKKNVSLSISRTASLKAIKSVEGFNIARLCHFQNTPIFWIWVYSLPVNDPHWNLSRAEFLKSLIKSYFQQFLKKTHFSNTLKPIEMTPSFEEEVIKLRIKSDCFLWICYSFLAN